jgi:hypothetical protein
MPSRPRHVIMSVLLSVFVLAGLLGAGYVLWDPDVPGDPDAVVVRIEFGGGALPPVYSSVVPSVTVYGDGRILERRTRHDGTDGESVLMDARLTRAAYREALLAGLGGSRDYAADAQIADGGLLEVGFRSEGRWHVTKVPQGADGVRVWLVRRLAGRVAGMVDGTDDLARRPTRYRPQRMAVVAWRPDQTGYGQDIVAERPWPLRPLAQDGTYPGERHVSCTVLTGREVAEVLAEQQRRLPPHRAASGTVGWRSGGHVYLVNFRPLMPEEKDCTDLHARW